MIRTSWGQSLIHYACDKGEIDVVRYLYEEGKASINTGDNNGTTPLLWAAARGELAVIDYLIKQGCDPLQKNIYGNTVIHLAAINNHLPVVKYFIEKLNFVGRLSVVKCNDIDLCEKMVLKLNKHWRNASTFSM